jgi:hypothetical protein
LAEFLPTAQVVQSEGRLCSTPFADVNPPNKYNWYDAYAPHLFPSGLKGWVQVCEGDRLLPGDSWGGMQYLDFWSGNLYPGKDFTGFDFEAYGRMSRVSYATQTRKH